VSGPEDPKVLPFPGGEGDPAARWIPAVEALLLASGEPVSVGELCAALGDPPQAHVVGALERLRAHLRSRNAGVEVVEVAGGWQLRTHPRFATEVRALVGGRPARLSQAALEVLSIVAYQQPVTRMEVEDIRGVASGAVLRHLGERGLVRTTGRREVPGRPLEYGTTRRFLELFGLADLKALPTLAEREALDDGGGSTG
jgi:segregation and condensation protein B